MQSLADPGRCRAKGPGLCRAIAGEEAALVISVTCAHLSHALFASMPTLTDIALLALRQTGKDALQ